MQDDAPPSPPPPQSVRPALPLRQIASSELFGSGREIVIEHAGRLYRLRITQNGKLILTA